MVSNVRRRIQAADSAFRLKAEFSYSLQSDYVKIVDSISRKRGFTQDKLGGHDDVLAANLNLKEDALLIANVRGTDAFSTLALLSFLGSKNHPKYNIYAIPNWAPARRSTKATDALGARLTNEFSDHHVGVAIVLKDGLPYFDSFYVAIPSKRGGTGKEESLVEHLRSRGHQLGAFSFTEDRANYPVVKSDNVLLGRLEKLGADVYGFIVTEEIETCVDALRFLINSS